jgi:hypothetical protein
MERARTNYLRHLGTDHRSLFEDTGSEAPGFTFVVRSMALDFFKPSHMDDLLAARQFPTPAYDFPQSASMTRPSGICISIASCRNNPTFRPMRNFVNKSMRRSIDFDQVRFARWHPQFDL